MGRFLWLSEQTLSKGEQPPQDGRVTRQIRISDTAPQPDRTFHSLAFPERRDPPGGDLKAYRTARKDGTRAFTLWADQYRQQVFAHVVTKSATKGGPATYEVVGAAGEPLALITRDPAMKGGRVRTRWTVQQAGAPTAVGLKGRPFWWFVWWLISPIQLAIAIGSIIGGGDIARTPRRTRWRIDRRVVLDFQSGAGSAFELEVLEDWWDDRVTAALVALLGSHDSWLGNAWDVAGE
ncbi:conserved hypothetical protein [Streptomyces himastatinicus ATCC 53653]|uniref:Uncharacterized protein n=1 Tax=Streptomyces himastatinicus ATCC 53653 TaxID=457427 RepID=D9WVI2_9ACTN|nr:hypothetical protein [Streptomyces himastatinicus]EFL22359.1 conserved hypothetical protein [Streptomyces himastatinicus ATCC 53653]